MKAMRRKGYTDKFTRAEVIELFNSGKYRVCLESGRVYHKSGRELYTYTNEKTDHPWVRLFKRPKYVTICISHVVWMVATQTVLPGGWQVHHRDADPTNNAFSNLMALHPMDHSKLHADLEEAPF